MINKFYWQVYLNLEKEVLSLADTIHIDDSQMEVYSMRIADLLMHVVVEIESLSKKLYFDNGGTHPNDKDLYFDTICLDKLNTDWHLEQKVVELTCPYFYVAKPDYLTMRPLKGANKGSMACSWIRAYNAVKHDRASQLQVYGRIRYLIKAIAALFLLNVYNNNVSIAYNNREESTKFDNSLGSSLFSIKSINYGANIPTTGDEKKDAHHDECTYIIRSTDQTFSEAQHALQMLNEKCIGLAIKNIAPNEISDVNKIPELITNKLKDAQYFANDKSLTEYKMTLAKKMSSLKFEALLNKNQAIHTTI